AAQTPAAPPPRPRHRQPVLRRVSRRPRPPSQAARPPRTRARGPRVIGGSFHYEEKGSVARLVLDRPAALNALTFDVYRDLTETFRGLAGRRDLRGVVLTGRGRAFCTGGDVKEIIGELLSYDPAPLRAFTPRPGDPTPRHAGGAPADHRLAERDGGGRGGGHRPRLRPPHRRRHRPHRLPLREGRPLGSGHGGRPPAAARRGRGTGRRAAHDRRVHRRRG